MNVFDQWLLKKPRTEEEHANLRKQCGEVALRVLGHKIEKYTCDDECAIARICRLAFDSYNTNGDCLLEK